MNIQISVSNFDEIIHPKKTLVRASHRITPIRQRLDSIDTRAKLRKAIDELTPDDTLALTPEAKEAQQTNEAHRRIRRQQLEAEHAQYAELDLNAATHYIEAADLSTPKRMRHKKD